MILLLIIMTRLTDSKGAIFPYRDDIMLNGKTYGNIFENYTLFQNVSSAFTHFSQMGTATQVVKHALLVKTCLPSGENMSAFVYDNLKYMMYNTSLLCTLFYVHIICECH